MSKVVWFTGHSTAGKSTVANEMRARFLPRSIILDGDEMRDSISLDIKNDFTPSGRRENNLRVARLAWELSKQTIVLVAVIAPLREVRIEIERICNPLWIFVKRTVPKRSNHFYEEPDPLDGYIVTDHDKLDVRGSSDYVAFELEKKGLL